MSLWVLPAIICEITQNDSYARAPKCMIAFRDQRSSTLHGTINCVKASIAVDFGAGEPDFISTTRDAIRAIENVLPVYTETSRHWRIQRDFRH